MTGDALRRARGDLRRRARGRHHRLRHGLGRSPQLLGRPGGEGAAARGRSSRSASPSSRARSRRPASSRPTSIASPRSIRCARSTWPTSSGRAAARDQPAAAPRRAHAASSTSGPATSSRRARRRTRIWRRTSRSSTWAATATRRCASTATRPDCEFVCIPRPLERSATPDGGPLRYRVSHRVALWRKGETPRLERAASEGDLGLSG